MKKYTAEELKDNYDRFIKAIEKSFEGERLEKLLHMYSEEELGMNLLLSPASGNKFYHKSYEGGYIDHIMNVARNSLRMVKLYQEAGGVIDFEQEELLFCAFHHDLGKLGKKGHFHYSPNDSEWHIKNRGDNYKRNEDIAFMSITDRTFFTLQEYGITYSENEYFGIKLTDGIFDDDNIKYYKTYDTSKYLKTNIQFILHWADWMSTTIERDNEIKVTSE